MKCILKIVPKLDLAQPMIEACKSNVIEITKTLIEHAIEHENVIRLETGPIPTAFHYACKTGNLEVVKLCLSYMNRLDFIKSPELPDMFSLSCESGNSELCMTLLTTSKVSFKEIEYFPI